MASVIRSSVDFSAEMFGDDEYRGNLADQPGTPPLSLPDSFDNGYDAPAGFGGSSNRGGYTSDAKLQAEVNRVTGLLQERTGAFRDLSISEGMYNDFRLRPETDLSTYELAQLKCHEFKRSTRKETEQLRRTLQETQALLVAADHRAEEATNTLARQSKMTKLDLDSMKTEVSTLEDRCSRMAAKVKEESELRLEMDEKVHNFDRIKRELDVVTKELNALKTLHDKQTTAVTTLTVSEQAARSAERDALRAKELLAMDKAYLSQELRASEARASESAKLADTNSTKVVGLEMKVQQLSDQLLNSQLDARTGVEDRIEKETQRIREDSKREMDALKEASREILDRENKVLREAKASAEAEVDKIRSNNSLLQNENTRLQTEIVGMQGKSVGELSELRAEVKLKNFELTALGTTFEERMTLFRQQELELKTTKSELDAHRAAFVKLESEHNVRTSDLKSQLEVATNRLKAYETLEEEIDNAVMRVAHAGAMNGGRVANDDIDNEDVSGLAGDLAAKSFFASLQSMPSQPERRARQAVLLAQKVLETEGQRDALKNELSELRTVLKAAKEQERAAEEALKRSSQPTVYLVTKLRDEEAAHQLTKAKVGAMGEVMRKKDKQLGLLSKDYSDVKERLTLILHQRADIDKIRDVLETLTAAKDDEQSMGDDDVNENDNMGGDMIMAAAGEDAHTMLNNSAFAPTSPAAGLTVDTSAAAGGSPRDGGGSSANKKDSMSSSHVNKMTTSPSVSPTAKGNGRWHKREQL